VSQMRVETKTVCIIILYCTGMDMGMRFTIPKYQRGGRLKGKGLPHTLIVQSRGDGFYIEPRFFTIEKHQRYVKKKYHLW